MKYIEIVLNFLNTYSVIILPALFGFTLIFATANWAIDVYRKQNKKIALCARCVTSFPHKTGVYVNLLPEDYRRQWRAYVNSGADKPSLVFEFVKIKRKIRLLWLFVSVAAVSAAYIAVYFTVGRYVSYLVFQAVLWLTFAVILLVNRLIGRSNERRAKQLFGKLVAQLNRNACDKNGGNTVQETVERIDQLGKQGVTDTAIAQASQLLRDKGLEAPRTVEQQRQLNRALNGLLQAYAHNAPQTV